MNSNNEIFYRNNVNLSNPIGNGDNWWILKNISVDIYGVWEVNSNDEFFIEMDLVNLIIKVIDGLK